MARVHCSFPVTCRLHGREFAVTVRDIGLEGMRLEIPLRVEPGQVLSLTYDNTLNCFTYATVRVRVVWSHQKPFTCLSEAGVAYVETGGVIEHSWVRHLLRLFDLDYLSARERREDIRVPVGFPGQVAVRGEAEAPPETIQGLVNDLGIGGALFESPIDLPIGTPLVIDIGPMSDGTFLTCDGHVVRRAGRAPHGHRLLGIRFDGPRDLTYEAVEPHLSQALFGSRS